MALISDWINKCLLCMGDAPGAIPVFSSHAQKKSVRRMIAEFLNVTVRRSDNFPRQICEKCYDTLQRINDLKESAHVSLSNLRLLQTLHQQKGQQQGKAEYIRLWLGSQTADQQETSAFDEQDLSNPQQQSDFTCSSVSANEATSSVLFNVSALGSESSDNPHYVEGVAKKHSQTSLHFSTPSSRSCSPQPGALPPESSKKQYRSTPRAQTKGHSKTPVNKVHGVPEKGADHSGSPRPGALPPEPTGKGLVSRKRSKNIPVICESTPLQTKSSEAELSVQEGSVNTYTKENVVDQRSRSCSPPRENGCSVPGKRKRGRPRSQSVPPLKRPKSAAPQHKTCKKWHMVSLAGKPTLTQPYLHDDVRFGRISAQCDLQQFKKHIPFVKLVKLNDISKPARGPECSVLQFPPLVVQTQQEFTLVELVVDEKSGNVRQLCWVCNQSFRTNKNMERHLMRHRGRPQQRTSFSEDVTDPSSKQALRTLFSCNLCDIHFSTRFALRRHKSFHSEKKWKYKCKECEETFRTNYILERHMLWHNTSSEAEEQQPRFTCSCCLQDFSSEEVLRKHMVQHRKCTLCNQTFVGKNELAAHVSSCHKVCSICDEAVTDEDELESHIETSHEKCNLCGEQFLGEEELGAHLSKHPYQCVLCLSAFNDKAQRNEHLRLSHQDMLELLKETISKKTSTP